MREKDTVNLKPRAWVRLKKGVYRDDLAQVDFVDTAQNSVHLRLIPRYHQLVFHGLVGALGELVILTDGQ